jgi:hypothetical protein
VSLTKEQNLENSVRDVVKDIHQNQQKVHTKKQVVYTGIENAVELVCKHNEDEYSTYLQTPTDLCNTQVEILEKITAGCSITDPNAIDRSFRKTWNIGAWHIGNKISISINIKQPNISGCWSVIKD